MGTPFTTVYDRFLRKITDDMYLELTPQDTMRDLNSLLIGAIPGFEFPRQVMSYEQKINTIPPKADQQVSLGDFVQSDEHKGIVTSVSDNGDIVLDESHFTCDLTEEEMNILAILMMQNWLQSQVTSIENIRMKYSGTDFKMTSQANHLSKLISLQRNVQQQNLHMQRLYKRRKTESDGHIRSNWACLREVSAIDD